MRLRSKKIITYVEKNTNNKLIEIRSQRRKRPTELRQKIIRIENHHEKQAKMTEHVNKINPLKFEGNLSENWKAFKRDFRIYLNAAELAGKAESVRISLLLNLAGKEAVELFETFALTEQQKASFKEITDAFDGYCNQQTNVVYERFLFYRRKQKESEPFDSYLTEITKLMKNCAFANSDEMLRDQIVMGVNDSQLQQKLLATKNLTHAAAIEKCRANEVTREQASKMNANETPAVNEIRNAAKKNTWKKNTGENSNNNQKKVDRERGQNRTTQHRQNQQQQQQNRQNNGRNYNNNNNSNRFDIINCKRCSRSHKVRECPAYGRKCNVCNKLNHFAACCKTKVVSSIDYENNSNDSDSANDYNEFFIGTIESVSAVDAVSRDGHSWTETIKVQEKDVSFKVDTGAAIDVLPLSLVKKLWPEAKLRKTSITLRAFGGQRLHPVGMCTLLCRFKGHSMKIDFAIVDLSVVPILGLKSCIQLEIVQPSRVVDDKRKQF